VTPLALLQDLERELLPELLHHEAIWQSLLIDYEPPVVERLWTPLPSGRLFLHRIHPCEQALFHPHPWPSAVKVVSGLYEMDVGQGFGTIAPPPVACRLLLPAGTYYEMSHPTGWHSVRPLGGPSLSLMLTMGLWDRPVDFPKPEQSLGPLSQEAKRGLLQDMRRTLCLH